MEYDPFADGGASHYQGPSTVAWTPSASMPMAGADGMGYPSSTAPVANAPWSMQPQQQQQQQQQQEQLPSCIPQAYPQDPQSLELVQQYTMGQGSAYGYGTTDPQQHAYPPPPDLLGEPGAPEAYSLGGAAQPAAQWAGGTAATYDGMQQPPHAGVTTSYDGMQQPPQAGVSTSYDGMQQPPYAGVTNSYESTQPPYGVSVHGGTDVLAQPQPQPSVRGAVAAAKQYALEMAASGAGGSASRRSRGRSRSRSRSRDRDRHRGRRERSRSNSRERRYVRRRSRDRSERGHRSKHLEDEEVRGRRSIDQETEEWGPYSRWRGRSGSREPQEPTPTIFIKGIPDISTEEDLQILLSPFPNVTSVRLVKNKETGMHRGFAFIDFASAADAARFMEPEQRQNHVLGGSRLYTEFTTPSQFVTAGAEAAARGGAMHADSRGGMAVAGPPLDWVCDMCQAVNFARRLECYQCSSPRPAVPKRVQMDTEGPSTILKVSGLGEDATEEGLRFMFSVHMPVLDVRLVRDKFSGAPRGFAFVELGSIADATRALNQLQNFVPEFQTTPIRLCYARDRGGGQPAASSAALPFEAVQEMQELSGWAPKEFTEGEDAEANGEEQQQQQQQQQEAGSTAAAAGTSAASASSSQPSGTSGYIYDETSGYYYDPVSGSHYDGNTGYFFFPTTQQWCMYDQASGQYIPVSASASTSAGPSTAAHAALATTENAVAAQRSASTGTATPGVKGNRPKGAVIGAKPQYNSQGLLAAVQQLSEKEAQQKALAQQKATVSSKPQVSKPPQVNPNSKAANPSANPGLGMTSQAQQRQAQQHQAQQHQAQQQQAQQQQAQQQQAQQQQAADAASVTGKIYRSKWSQRH